MCSTCGCSDHTNIHVHELNQPDAAPVEHSHASLNAHDHSNAGHHHVHTETDHRHSHQVVAADSRSAKIVQLERDILAKNSLIAQRNRGWLEGREVLALNLMSSPGAGKTTLLERTIRELDGAPPVLVVEGDQATARDAVRIRRAGGRAIQINTGSGCHLDAAMLSAALATLNPPQHSLLLIENVGNLVCPALFDLGEAARVVLMSATEGEDKPLKYPNIFRFADVMILNKTDLLPHLSFDVDECIRYARQVNPKLAIFGLSALSGAGLANWYAWLRTNLDRLPV